jgi:BirA family transcriptional regulator, biotin operon repressor / biotin---[acetyl-CoA-carboxylase] ligase
MLIADPHVDEDGLLACQALLASTRLTRIRYFAEIDSTNTAALRDLANRSLDTSEQCNLATGPSLYVADRQTAGRGRHGRNWVADQGTLTFSIVMAAGESSCDEHTAAPVSMRISTAPLSIAVGVAVARAIDHLAAPFSARIKWPNDVYLGEGKVAGILIESSPPDGIVIGVGLNVATRLSDISGSFDSPARSISELTQRTPHRYQWLPEIVSQILDAIDEQVVAPGAIMAEQRRRCLLAGQPIRYLVDQAWHHAHCEGVAEDGALLIKDSSGTRRLLSGEVQRLRKS